MQLVNLQNCLQIGIEIIPLLAIEKADIRQFAHARGSTSHWQPLDAVVSVACRAGVSCSS